MQCEEFENRLHTVLDERGRPELDPELRRHSETCPECHEAIHAYGVLLDGFYTLISPPAPADLSARVLADLRPTPATARRLALAGALLTTAAGLVMVVVGLSRMKTAEQPLAQIAASPVASSAATPGAAPLSGAPLANSLIPPVAIQGEAVKTDPIQTASTGAAPPPADTVATSAASSGAAPRTSGPTTTPSAILPGGEPNHADPGGQPNGAENASQLASSMPAYEVRANDPYVGLAKLTGKSLAALMFHLPGSGKAKSGKVQSQAREAGPVAAKSTSDRSDPVNHSVSETLNLLLFLLPGPPQPRGS